MLGSPILSTSPDSSSFSKTCGGARSGSPVRMTYSVNPLPGFWANGVLSTLSTKKGKLIISASSS